MLPQVLEVAIPVRSLELPLRRTILPQLVLRPRLQTEALERLRHVWGGRDEGRQAVHARQKAQQALLDEHALRDADGPVREALVALHDPPRREVELPRWKLVEPGGPEDDDDRLHAWYDVRPVVAGDLDLRVDVEGDVGEGVGGERPSGLPDRDTGDDVEAVFADGREVVLGQVAYDSLNLEDRGTVVAAGREVTESRVVVKEL